MPGFRSTARLWAYALAVVLVLAMDAKCSAVDVPPPQYGWALQWWSWAHWWEARRGAIQIDQTPGPDLPALQPSSATIKALVAATHDHDPHVAADAVLALGRMKVSATTPRIIDLTQDDRKPVRRAALLALGLIGNESARKALMKFGDRPGVSAFDAESWVAAAGLLDHPGKPMLKKVGKLLIHSNVPSVRRIAAWVIRLDNPPGTVSLMRDLLHHTKDAMLASSAILALGEDKARSEERLIAEMYMESGKGADVPSIKAWQSLCVQQIGLKIGIVTEYCLKVSGLRAAAAIALGLYTPPAHGSSPALEYLAMPYNEQKAPVIVKGDYGFRHRFIQIGGDGKRHRIVTFRQDSNSPRWYAYDNSWPNNGCGPYGSEQRLGLISLGEIGGYDEAKILQDVLKSRFSSRTSYDARYDPDRGFAAIALGLYLHRSRGAGQTDSQYDGEAAVILRLLKRVALDDKEPPDQRAACALALGLSGQSDAKNILRDIASQIQPSQTLLAAHVVLGMGLLHDSAALAIARHLMGSANKPVSAAAIMQQGFNHPLPLVTLLARRAMIEGLGRLGDKKGAALLKARFGGNQWVSREVVRALKRCRDESIEPLLVKLLTSAKRAKVRALAASCLGMLFDPQPVPRLHRLVQGVDFMLPSTFGSDSHGKVVEAFRGIAQPFFYQYWLVRDKRDQSKVSSKNWY